MERKLLVGIVVSLLILVFLLSMYTFFCKVENGKLDCAFDFGLPSPGLPECDLSLVSGEIVGVSVEEDWFYCPPDVPDELGQFNCLWLKLVNLLLFFFCCHDCSFEARGREGKAPLPDSVVLLLN